MTSQYDKFHLPFFFLIKKNVICLLLLHCFKSQQLASPKEVKEYLLPLPNPAVSRSLMQMILPSESLVILVKVVLKQV